MGGASNRAWNIARAMQASGHEVIVIAAYSYYPHGRVSPAYRGRLFTREKREGFEVISVWIPSIRTQGYFNRLLIYTAFTFSYSIAQLMLICRQLDLVYYVSPYPLSVFSMPAIVFGRLVGAQVFLDVADLWPEVILEIGSIKTPFATTVTRAMAKIVSRLSDLTTPITESILERLLELGLSRRKLEVVELAIDTDYFRPKPPKLLNEQFRGKFLAEYSGIIGPKYDFESLIEAAKIIGRTNPEVLVLIRGDGESLPYVKRIASSSSNVMVLDKIEGADTVLDYLNAADVLLCPMRDLKETSTIVPSKVLEYFAVGKPVVCSGRGETEVIMNHYVPGIMVPPADPAALASAIMRLQADRQFYEASARNARELAVQRYELSTLCHTIEKLVEGRR
jgi:glycosyltransferase involved in cell wall biosynthesis